MDDHVEIDRGVVAIVSDRGYRHHRNEDSGDVIVQGDRIALIVCDGVSSTANPDQASAAAAEAATKVLTEYLGTPSPSAEPGDEDPTEIDPVAGDPDALVRAVTAARLAVSDVPAEEPGGYPGAPSTTMVAAVVSPSVVVVAGVGDSRAYWLPDRGPNRRLTVDDSWAEAAIAAGVPEPAAYAAPQAHVITNWIGGDASHDHPTVVTEELTQAGLLVVCSDGLWNYLPDADDIAAAVAADDEDDEGAARPLAVARRLVRVALDAGGADNVTVAVTIAGP